MTKDKKITFIEKYPSYCGGTTHVAIGFDGQPFGAAWARCSLYEGLKYEITIFDMPNIVKQFNFLEEAKKYLEDFYLNKMASHLC